MYPFNRKGSIVVFKPSMLKKNEIIFLITIVCLQKSSLYHMIDLLKI